MTLQKDFDDKISALNLSIQNLQADVTSANDKIKSLTQRLDDDTQEQRNKYDQQQQNRNKIQYAEILYAPIPNSDESFSAAAVTNVENSSSTFYKFTLTAPNSQTASFEFLNVVRAVNEATSSPEMILKPACKALNPLNQNAKEIRTVKPGVVTRNNDKWIIGPKAEIRYE